MLYPSLPLSGEITCGAGIKYDRRRRRSKGEFDVAVVETEAPSSSPSEND